MTDSPEENLSTTAQSGASASWLGLFAPVRFARLYAVLGLAHLLAEWLSVAYLTKPLLLPLLSLYWWHQTQSRRDRQAIWMQVALLFACMGDVLLMVEHQNPLFFLLGLGSFLVMQVLYAGIFFADARRPARIQLGQLVVITIAVGWIAGQIVPQLPPDMKGPVIVYMLAITGMVYLALLRQRGVNNGANRVYIGALLFLVSDTMIALNHFLTGDWLSEFLIMPTYIVAQYLIVTGLLAGRNRQ